MRPETAYVALGSNLGDRAGYLAAARGALAALPDTQLVAVSDIEETAPLGPVGQPSYLNQMVALKTTLEPIELLERLHEIERTNGRVRTIPVGTADARSGHCAFRRPTGRSTRPRPAPSGTAQPSFLATRDGANPRHTRR